MSTPCELGYRMTAEWEPHTGTWVSWPQRNGVSFHDRYDAALPVFSDLVRTLAAHETVHINVADAGMEEQARQSLGIVPRVQFHRIPTSDPWCRDHGPIFVKSSHHLAVVDWLFNAWGEKYTPYDRSNAVPSRVAMELGLPCFQPGMVLEGGSLDTNGTGLLLTTESCLLHPNRNPHLAKPQIERHLRDYLGIKTIIWLDHYLAGDDTDGHVDNLARFVNETTVVVVVEDDPLDGNYAALQDNRKRLLGMKEIHRVVELPTPGVVQHRGQRLPASYANFYIANEIVIMPVFRHANDMRAQTILQSLFPDRRVVPLDSSEILVGGGSFHCLTQQQPRL